ncbi:hypothetical protein cypCar_00016589 [Cyprinus carpio]|nr:hypothetical protein cypCar_00016589 [Cyprinus carpio]
MSTTMQVHAGAAVGVATERGGGDPETRMGRGRDKGPTSNPIHFTPGEMEAFLQQKQAEQDKQLKQQEMELRREADIELDIQRQKNQELFNKYQSEKQQLQNKIPALIHSAVQELHEELAVLQERIKEQEEEMKQFGESASQRQHQLLEERRTGEAQLQSALQELQQKTQELNQAQSNIQQLKEERATLQEEVKHIFPPPFIYKWEF